MPRLFLVLLIAWLAGCSGAPTESEAPAAETAPQDAAFLVSQKAASSIAFYSWDGELVDEVPVGTHPHEIVLSPDGRLLYVADNGTMAIEQAGEGGNTVSIVDIESRQKVGEVDLGKYHRPHGIDFVPSSGLVLVSTENPDQLLAVDPEKQALVREYDTKGQTPHIVTASLDGRRAFVSNARSGNVAAIDLESGETTLIKAGGRPEGSVLSSDGKTLYVVNRETNEISIIDTEKNENVGSIPTGATPVRVKLTGDDKVLIYALMDDNQVGFAEVESREQVATVDIGGPPVSLELSQDGQYALAGAQEADTIYVVSVPDRKLVHEFKTTDGAGPDPALYLGKE